MRTIVDRACGLDVHQAVIVACVLLGEAGYRVGKEVRQFGTTTAELRRLRAWLLECGVTHVIWIPDSELGTWEPALSSDADLRLIRVCREGEAIAVAAGW